MQWEGLGICLTGTRQIKIPMTCPYLLWNLQNYLCMILKKYCFMSNKCLQISVWNLTNNKNELWKTVRLKSFQKLQFQSLPIFFKFVHPYLLCCIIHVFYLLFIFEQLIFKFHSVCWQLSLFEFCLIFQHSSFKLFSMFLVCSRAQLFEGWLALNPSFFFSSIGRNHFLG